MSAVDREKSITESEDRSNGCEPNLVHHVNADFHFKLGMMFKSEEEAYNTYNTYAIMKGFGVRKGQKHYNRKNELTRCIFLCSCEGQCTTRDPHEQRKRIRTEYRCGCLAHIKFKIENGLWEVIEFDDSHSHPFVEDSQKQFISSSRKLPKASRSVLGPLMDIGIRVKKVDVAVKEKKDYRNLENEASGVENVAFTNQGCHNFFQPHMMNSISASDAQALINHLKRMQVEDATFFHTFQFDDGGRLCNFFWRDGMSRLHYECFGDVVIFDSTYRTNTYNMICAPFIGVNHHWKNVLFGCALLSSDTASSYTWLFEAFLQSMGGKAPKTIFTNQDEAMAVAIEKVFPGTRHRLCEWHIEKNAAQNVPHLFGKPDFRDKYFNKLLWRCESESEFELTWKKMEADWNTKENQWLNKLYEVRKKWCAVFSHDTFSAGIKSTRRSDSTINIFNHMACKTMTIIEFVKHYEERAKEMRDTEASDDYTTRGRPRPIIDGCGILVHASTVYTGTIFRKFQQEFMQGMSELVSNTAVVGTRRIYTLQRSGGAGSHIVEFDSSDCSIVCNCHMFESVGWLCCHALRVLHMDLGFTNIPSQYILKRWTKAAKQGLGVEDYVGLKKNAMSSSVTDRLNRLMRKAFAVMSMGANDDESEEIASRYLDHAAAEITKYQSRLSTAKRRSFPGSGTCHLKRGNFSEQQSLPDFAMEQSPACIAPSPEHSVLGNAINSDLTNWNCSDFIPSLNDNE